MGATAARTRHKAKDKVAATAFHLLILLVMLLLPRMLLPTVLLLMLPLLLQKTMPRSR